MTWCDPETGTCTVQTTPDDTGDDVQLEAPLAGVRIMSVTDPICSACWGMEPAWRSLMARYGDLVDVALVYGGLLPNWDGFSDPGAGISGPADVASHWDEFSRVSGQPIDSSVWFTDPLASSYPACTAAIAVRLVAPGKESAYLRHIRELLFLHARNIARPDVLRDAAAAVGVDLEAFDRGLADGSAVASFEADRRLTRRLRVRGFPTTIVSGPAGRLVRHGATAPDRLEDAILVCGELQPRPHLNTAVAIERLGVGTTAEYAAVLGLSQPQAEHALTAAGIRPQPVGVGEVWIP